MTVINHSQDICISLLCWRTSSSGELLSPLEHVQGMSQKPICQHRYNTECCFLGSAEFMQGLRICKSLKLYKYREGLPKFPSLPRCHCHILSYTDTEKKGTTEGSRPTGILGRSLIQKTHKASAPHLL